MALVSPVIIMMILASADMVSFLVANQKISRASYTISNLITQMDEGLTESQLSDMMLSLGEVSKPLDLAADGRATVTAIIGVGTDGSAPTSYQVAWQRCYGSMNSTNNFGSAGSVVATSDIPENMIVMTSQVLVVTEVVYNFTPIIGFIDIGERIEYLSYFRPRRGSIENIIPDSASTTPCS
ncbi:MAG: hypothetical protein COB54_06370 [Alphaproteobacteria bacterium]|nr:MAG: hypothetical protein COB54_06370 [Alphaproteobacteria bacterium]